MILRPEQRTKLDPTSDREFYAFPRYVTHVDGGFIRQLIDLYRQQLKPQSRILDLMSSWVSHLPPEMKFAHVEGHGMNQEELARNSQLDHYFIQDLNLNPQLPFPDQDFAAVLITVSVQYLQYPEAVFSEIYRLLQPGGIAIVSFSNRMFSQKAIAACRDGNDFSRIALVKRYFQSVPGFGEASVIARPGSVPGFWQAFGILGSDPFYAVLAQRL
jgi:SAM-dependent methyltransferase